MRITVLTVGKIKEKFYTKAIEEYAKRLSRYCKLEIIEVADEKTPDGVSEASARKIKEKEGERLLSHVRESMYVIALAIEGKMRSSEDLSEHLAALWLYGDSHIVFVIGGSLGLSDPVLKRADERLSFSKMTFPHQLMRVILLEQIYRSFKIQAGEPYHK
ncbi:MAG: 23S rRNA (pseudouridine(1915)-N(3))-methyltransferase RlmH [Lachnospiraceae bacterium]|jgi:23S rRNA (pseudouridine1915-N3)-methyltransferase|nr:23S rRNA (pseudouridine(1915)-N(3))-methyltransferase RlmH [Lachnospiraceae bacterium]